ncbi:MULTISPECIES: AEC family transporter [unclassified Cupriavidus]|uniref:AEC family transporter n=1 Tax=unclassified Cupriavidus TaxID=2640874 RepID=UPI00313C4C40
MDLTQLILPMFAIVLAGWALAAMGVISPRVGEGLSDYVFAVAVPALIVQTMAQPNEGAAIHVGYWIAYFGGCALVWGLLTAFMRWRGMSEGQAAVIGGFASSQSNTVFFGVPIILAVYGDAGKVPLFLLLAVHLPIMMTAATVLIERGDGGTMRARLGGVANRLARNPIIIALVLGGILRTLRIPLTGTPATIVNAFGVTASTCALFSLGISMQQYRLRDGLGVAALITFGKLVLHPLFVWVIAFHVFDMPPAYAGVATMFAAMPVGINSYLLALRYRAGEAAVSSAVVLSTIVSSVTIAGWIKWLMRG